MAWPKKLFDGVPRQWNLDQIHFTRGKHLENPEYEREMHRDGQNWLAGYIIPPFQRPLVWNEGRMIKFIESAVLGLHLGTWCYNRATNAPIEKVRMDDGRVREFYHYTDRWIIDGQQRLTALDRFFDDAFPVFGSRWSEVDRLVQRRFLNNTSFSAYETKIYDEQELRVLYDRLNFGGVPHTPDQRATKDSDVAGLFDDLIEKMESDEGARPAP